MAAKVGIVLIQGGGIPATLRWTFANKKLLQYYNKQLAKDSIFEKDTISCRRNQVFLQGDIIVISVSRIICYQCLLFFSNCLFPCFLVFVLLLSSRSSNYHAEVKISKLVWFVQSLQRLFVIILCSKNVLKTMIQQMKKARKRLKNWRVQISD